MRRLLFILLSLATINNYSQEDLLAKIDTVSTSSDVSATFKGLKIVNFESTKMVSAKQFYFVVSHRFGTVKNGIDDFFGLDQAVTRLNFIYGISDIINIGVSRSSFQKIYESSLKVRLQKQQLNGFPFTIVSFNSLQINTALDEETIPSLEFKDRLGFAFQVLVARKFTENLSLEIIPTVFHDNYVPIENQDKTQYALGLGGRYKLTKRWSFNIDYGIHLNRADDSPFNNPLSIGFDLETGGHVFQMHFTNSQPMNTNAFLGQATGDWGDGDFYFGFNLSRVF